MTYKFWKLIFFTSGGITVFLILLTLFFIIKFRFFELLRFVIANRKAPAGTTVNRSTVRREERTAVTEKLSELRPNIHSGITPDGTVIASRPEENENGFAITRNIIIINTDPSVIDMI